MAYVTPDELAVWMGLGEQMPTAQVPRAELLLGVAQGLVDDELGQNLEVATQTTVLRGTGTCELVLPRWPVLAVASVQVEGDTTPLVDGTDFTWEPSGVLTRRCGVWPCGKRVTVDSTAGHNPVPKSVVGVVCDLVAGKWDNAKGGKKSERIGDYQVAWDRVQMSLSTADKKSLSRYTANR
ncbi:hypothetical protein BBK82_05015 [Lentzea guizhouensis]|uniref:Head-to-tail adaptor n=1 Tax=Lentzea guizhouensis TaxID=1586287 RepID=A0A1B2HCS1_9PSEU|nr:hypothetical protein [Lentzea guizhouensis]ANZ35534.1 hypothetical protein BBK82_05015 [Lentzea guizhouensis]